jgi:hypothetical protein
MIAGRAMAGTEYEVSIRGLLTPALVNAITALDWQIVTAHGATTLRGTVRDQSELHGLLDSLKAMSVELLEVRRVQAGAT